MSICYGSCDCCGELPAALEDSARLDWLEKSDLAVMTVHAADGWRVKDNAGREYVGYKTLREAIDAAASGRP